MKFETRAIHAGQEPDPNTGAVIVPVYQTSTYRQEAVGMHKGFEYSRTGNPTRTALETALASLEEGKFGLAFASGVAATNAVFSLLKAGDHVVAGNDLYGGTYRLLEKIVKKWGITTTYVDVEDAGSFERAIKDNTRLIWVETPTNPLLKIADIAAISRIAHKDDIIFAVDNTFASPYFQQPLLIGADIVVHSTTKYIAGHSDIVGGAVILNDRKLYDDLRFFQNAAGAVPGPWDSWLALRGLKTLAVRMKAHESNALFLAKYLSKHAKIKSLHYPGLSSNKNHSVAKEQMKGFSGMFSFELKGGRIAVDRFFAGLKIFTLAESLGGVESLISYPAGMTHGSMPPEERSKRGITEGLVRVSVGLEDKHDLKKDLAASLKNC
jgi:cystathionine gamma-synthase/cystathionine gamma-lyase